MGWAFAGIGSVRVEGLGVGPERGADMPELVIIDLTDHEVQVAVRHPDGGMLLLTAKAHRGSLTVIGPRPVAVKVLEDSGEVAVSWRADRKLLDARDTDQYTCHSL